jgi:hypothetical protein
MRKLVLALVSAGSVAASVPVTAAHAENGNVAAGIIGGLAVGTLFGAAAAGPRYYEPAPVYTAPRTYIRECYWERGEPVWDDYRGRWFRPRIHVCD